MKNRAKSHWSDEELVHHYLNNEQDEEAFRVLYNRYEVSLLKYVASKIDNRSDAEEIVQDALYRAFKHLNELKDAKNFQGWLFSIACQLVAAWYRENEKRIELESIFTVSEQRLYAAAVMAARADQQDAIDRAQSERVRNLVDTLLSKREREAILLRLEGLSYEEVAHELGASANGVHKLLYRAYKKLRAKISVAPFSDESLEEEHL